jgi:hypothetical protein
LLALVAATHGGTQNLSRLSQVGGEYNEEIAIAFWLGMGGSLLPADPVLHRH